MSELITVQYKPTIEDAKALMPVWETVYEAVALVQQEFPTSRILRERSYLTVYQVCKNNSYADYVIQIVQCPECKLLIYGQPSEWCPKCGEHAEHFEEVEMLRCATQGDFLQMMEDTVGMKKATAYNRVQTYRRLCGGLGWTEEMAFAYHLWSGDTPRVVLDRLGKWQRDGILIAINCPHRLPGVDREKVIEALDSVKLLENPSETTDKELDLAMEIAIELMGGHGEVEMAVQSLNDLVRESLSQEIASLVELRPQDAKERVQEDLLGKGHLEWHLYRDKMGAINFGLSFFQKVAADDGTLYEKGRVDRIVTLGVLPSWVELQLMKRFRKASIAPKPPERFISPETDALIEFLDRFGGIAAGDTLRERVESVVKHYATQIGRIERSSNVGQS